jgi:hypothetical protein
MRETINRLHYLLTGEPLSERNEDDPNIGTVVKSGDLSGVTVIPGIDGNGEQIIPSDSYPHIVIEPLREIEVNTLFKRVVLVIDCAVRVPGRFSALFGRSRGLSITDFVSALRRVLKSNHTLRMAGTSLATQYSIDSIEYSLGTNERGSGVGRRYATFTVTYTVPIEQ